MPRILQRRYDDSSEVVLIPAGILVSCRVNDPAPLLKPLTELWEGDPAEVLLACLEPGYLGERFYLLEEFGQKTGLIWRQVARLIETSGRERILKLNDLYRPKIESLKPRMRHFVLPYLMIGDIRNAEGTFFEVPEYELLVNILRQMGFPADSLDVYPAIVHRSQLPRAAASQIATSIIWQFEEKGVVAVENPPSKAMFAALAWPDYIPLPPESVTEEEDFDFTVPVPEYDPNTYREVAPKSGLSYEEYNKKKRQLLSQLNRKDWVGIPVEAKGLKEWLQKYRLEDNTAHRISYYLSHANN